MTRMTINSDASLQNVIGELRETYKARKYITVSVIAGKGRSIDQNSLSHAWYQQVALELREDTANDVKRFCKLHFGVPILRAENAEFRASYDAAIRSTLTYEQKLIAMDFMPVTSLMTTGQISEYMTKVQAHYLNERGVVLEFPAEAAS